MSVRQYLTGKTYSINMNFFDDVGIRTPVDDATITVYTPHKTEYTIAGLTPDTLVVGKYNYNFYAASGLTRGHWFALGSGITASTTVFSEAVPFEIVDISLEPYWLGLSEFREYLDLTDDDRSRDSFFKQMLQSAIELVETYTRRTFGIGSYTETIEVKHSERLELKHFPIISITGLTATGIGRITPFYYTADNTNGIIKLTDSSGFDLCYDSALVTIEYEAGFLTVPEPVRMSALMLASKLSNLATSEGISTVRLADLSFSLDKGLFEGPIAEMLKQYRV